MSVGHSPLDIPPCISSRTVRTGQFPSPIRTFHSAVGLTLTPDPNRSTSINFVYVNGRSLYIVDRRIVVMDRGIVTFFDYCALLLVTYLFTISCKTDGTLARKEMSRVSMSGEICPGGNVRIPSKYRPMYTERYLKWVRSTWRKMAGINFLLETEYLLSAE